MPGCILQLNFKLNVDADEYERAVTPLADAFAAIDGLRWKVWLLNAAEGEAGGIYLFESEAAREAFLASALADAVRAAPFLRDLVAKRFDLMDGVTAVTRGPVGAISSAPPLGLATERAQAPTA